MLRQAAPCRVLITRPEPGASATARRLAQAGFVPLVLPLSQVSGLRHEAQAGAFDAAAATSANALRFADPGLLATLRDIPFFAVGARTAQTARAAGFARVREAAGDAAALARLVAATVPGARVAYLCGRVRRPDFEAGLREGVEVVPFETYDTLPCEPSHQAIEALGRVDAVLLFSVLGAEAFARLAARAEAAPLLAPTTAFAMSSRIAAVLPPEMPRHIAERPDEAALFAVLREWAGG